MDSVLISKIAGEVQSNLHLADDFSNTVQRYVRRAVNRILVFCGREDFPTPLEDIAAQIAEDMLRADGVAGPTGAVASVTRGDTSITYQDANGGSADTVDFVKDYTAQLVPFKKMRLPKDVPT